MKNNEIIQFAALFAIAAVLLYRKYGKRKSAKENQSERNAGKAPDSSRSGEEEYEPYRKKEKNE